MAPPAASTGARVWACPLVAKSLDCWAEKLPWLVVPVKEVPSHFTSLIPTKEEPMGRWRGKTLGYKETDGTHCSRLGDKGNSPNLCLKMGPRLGFLKVQFPHSPNHLPPRSLELPLPSPIFQHRYRHK